jgi:hypothetical protein
MHNSLNSFKEIYNLWWSTFSHVFATLLEATFRVVSNSKISSHQSHKSRNFSQVHTSMFAFYPSTHQNIRRLKCQSSLLWVSQRNSWCLFLRRYFCTPESIKKNISNQVMHVFESRELPTMSRVLPMHALPQIEQTSSIGNYGIMMWYIRVVEYFTGYMCWPNPSMWIVRRNPKHVLFSNTQKLLFASRSHQ